MTRAEENCSNSAGNYQFRGNQIGKHSQPPHNHSVLRQDVPRQQIYQPSLQRIEVQNLSTDSSLTTTTSHPTCTKSQSCENNSIYLSTRTPTDKSPASVQNSLQPLSFHDHPATVSSASTGGTTHSHAGLSASSFSIEHILTSSLTKGRASQMPIDSSNSFCAHQGHASSVSSSNKNESPVQNASPLSLDAHVSESNRTLNLMRVNYGLSPMKASSTVQKSLAPSTSSTSIDIPSKDSVPSSQPMQTLKDALNQDDMPTLEAENSRKCKTSDPQLSNYSIGILETPVNRESIKKFSHENQVRLIIKIDANLQVENAMDNTAVPCPVSSQDLSITKLQVPQRKRKRPCQCPNCSVEGGNQTRNAKGILLHKCHVPSCGKVFQAVSRLEEHIKCHSSENPYPCTWDGCELGFESMIALNMHRTRCHEPKKAVLAKSSAKRNNKAISKSDSSYACDIPNCGRTYESRRAFRHHFLKHERGRTYHCTWEMCGKSFFTKANLTYHMKWHETLSKCPCANCAVEGGNKTKNPDNGRPEHMCPDPDCRRIFSHTRYFMKHLDWHKKISLQLQRFSEKKNTSSSLSNES